MKTDNATKTVAFKLKGSLYTLTVMFLLNDNFEEFKAQLNKTINQAPKLFQSMPIVIDCAAISDKEFDFALFVQYMRSQQVFPIAVQNANAWVTTLAQVEGLAVMSGSTQQTQKNPALKIHSVKHKWDHAKIHQTAVRSGQQIVASNSDLVVLSHVSQGAELLADGNIYVYGTLRGRALAGINGYAEARIFCQSLQAELIAINGVYRLNENMLVMNEPCQIYLENDKILVQPLVSNFS